jgi:hypothetical protein
MKARSPSIKKIATARLESKQTLAKIVKSFTKPFTYEDKHDFKKFHQKVFPLYFGNILYHASCKISRRLHGVFLKYYEPNG